MKNTNGKINKQMDIVKSFECPHRSWCIVSADKIVDDTPIEWLWYQRHECDDFVVWQKSGSMVRAWMFREDLNERLLNLIAKSKT